jgi:single-strand DNA-binding protein
MFSELCRVGRDTELRVTQSGKAVASVSLAYDVGYGDNKRTAWIEGVLWEKRAESMAQYLTKGTQVYVAMDDMEAEAYTNGQGEPKAKLKGRIVEIKFAGPKPEQSATTPARPAPKQASPDPMSDDDIPW